MATGTKDLQTLQAMGDQGRLAIELREALDRWKKSRKPAPGRYDVRNFEFAEAVGITNGALSKYLNAIQMPDYEACKRIAAVVGPNDEYWLTLAHRPNFPQFIERVQKDPIVRNMVDGDFVLRLLRLTGGMNWRMSQSFWKERAERALQANWDARNVYQAAREIAEYIYIWSTDKKRETPFQERRSEAII